jgi:predicted nucleic-acid-binding protein
MSVHQIYLNQMQSIESIKEEILAYNQMSFATESADYKFNKAVKIKLQHIIVDCQNDDFVIHDTLYVLAQNTGCAEDQEIAEEILNHLLENKYITTEHLDFFYKNVSTARWE